MVYNMPVEWYSTERWGTVAEMLRWLPAPYADRKQALILWARQVGIGLSRYHYESIARPGEAFTDAGTT